MHGDVQEFDESDWRALWGFAARYPQAQAEFMKLGDEMHRYDKAVWYFGRNPDSTPPERPNLLQRLGEICNSSPEVMEQFSREVAEAIRCREFSRKQAQPFSRSLYEIGPVEKPREGGPFTGVDWRSSLAQSGPVEFSEWRDAQ